MTNTSDAGATHSNSTDDGRHDFDFLVGDWRIHNRKLSDMADPECDRWVEFEAAGWMRPTLGGLGNVDTFSAPQRPGGGAYEGMSLRLFDPRTGLWSIWWASDADPGRLDPPVTGRFENGRGTFLGEDVVGGKAVGVRLEWTVTGADAAVWEQAFSWDQGASWIHNWRMSFSRIAE